MSPSIDQFSKEMKSKVEVGDILIRVFSDRYGINYETKHYRVVETNASGFQFPKDTLLGRFVRRYPKRFEKECVVVQEITPHGTAERKLLFPKDMNLWENVIRRENWIENPPLRER